jgi:hypothetical protein
MIEQLIFEIPIISAVDLEHPVDQNREEMQWENLRTETKPIEQAKIFGDTGIYICFPLPFHQLKDRCSETGVSCFEHFQFL